METEYHSQHNNYIESGVSSDEDDDYFGESSDDDNHETSSITNKRFKASAHSVVHNIMAIDINPQPLNLVQQLFNRERTNHFSGRSVAGQLLEHAFIKVPNRLSFCLKDILYNRYLQGHVFMGLTACGQFLLSYKVCCNDNAAVNHYSFNVGYKYTLFFWIFQPHKPLRSYFQCCLFDDHGVDNIKVVTMTQWKNADTRVLIVHGAPVDESDDSYITYVKVPKLGCLECKKQRDSQEYFLLNVHCLNCNLTVHTKYGSSDTDPKFDPYINLLCPERILIIANGFLHMLRIDIETPVAASNAQQVDGTSTSALSTTQHNSGQTLVMAKTPASSHHHDAAADEKIRSAFEQQSIEVEINLTGGQKNVISRIFDDFTDIESDPNSNRNANDMQQQQQQQQQQRQLDMTRKTIEELILSSNSSSPTDSGSGSGSNSKTPSPSKAGSISLKRKRHERIVTKSFRNGIVTIDLQGATTSSSSSSSSSAAATPTDKYEFSEDNEKCEKISTLRKRRLADKKYEFSEDNSENIIPFTKMRSAVKSTSLAAQLFSPNNNSGAHSSNRSLHRFSPTTHCFHNSPCASPSSSPHPSSTQSPCSNNDARHYMSPSPNSTHLEFRSPPSCPSPASSSVMRSPNRQPTAVQIYNQKSPPSLSQATLQMLSYKPLGALSPLQVSMTKRLDLGGSMSPNTGMSFMSPRREEQRIVEVPLQGGIMAEKPICTKKLKRRYVEEDDATSVITSEEDDCISPGYHTSLPVEVHGACYSEMQMVSQASYQRLRCTSVVITQHSFDLETFTYYVISTLCQKNQKTYDVFYDWAYEVINVCPLSQTVSCLLMVQFSARDLLPTTPTNCLNCTSKFDCLIHRHQYECRILFTWNMETGKWQVLDYGEMKEFYEISTPIKKCGTITFTFPQQAKKLACDVTANLIKLPDYKSNLRVLGSDIKKSKQSISDLDNMIEFNLKRRFND